MTSAQRMVFRNHRHQAIGVASLLFVAGLVVLIYIVITSPGNSLDHPGGFTKAGRALALVGCFIATAAIAGMAVGGLRVALILDETGLVIRNPWRTTTVRWESRPKFEIRDRRQDVSIVTPPAGGTGSGPWLGGRITYRYRGVVCIAGRQRIWIAATSRMRHRDRVDAMLEELRQAKGRFKSQSASHAEASE